MLVALVRDVHTVKVKESRNRPGVAQKFPGGLRSQILWRSAREDREVVSLTNLPPLPPVLFLILIFTRGWVDPRAMVRSEGNMSLKNPVTPRRIDPGIVQQVVQRLNHYATPGPNTKFMKVIKKEIGMFAVSFQRKIYECFQKAFPRTPLCCIQIAIRSDQDDTSWLERNVNFITRPTFTQKLRVQFG